MEGSIVIMEELANVSMTQAGAALMTLPESTLERARGLIETWFEHHLPGIIDPLSQTERDAVWKALGRVITVALRLICDSFYKALQDDPALFELIRTNALQRARVSADHLSQLKSLLNDRKRTNAALEELAVIMDLVSDDG